jgi:hypothetical protein
MIVVAFMLTFFLDRNEDGSLESGNATFDLGD